MNDRTLAMCELSNDLLYHKIPKDKLPYYVDASLKAGADAAAEYQGLDLAELYRRNKIAVEYKEDGKGSFGLVYRGQITLSKEGCSLEIFRSSIQELADNSIGDNFPAVDYETANQIHLAHEFFHFLEYNQNRFVSHMLEPVITAKLFGLKRRAHINRCSEVAAHAFAKTFLSLPVLPNYYDYRYLINTGKMSQASFEGMMARYQEACSVNSNI